MLYCHNSNFNLLFNFYIHKYCWHKFHYFFPSNQFLLLYKSNRLKATYKSKVFFMNRNSVTFNTQKLQTSPIFFFYLFKKFIIGSQCLKFDFGFFYLFANLVIKIKNNTSLNNLVISPYLIIILYNFTSVILCL